MSNRFEELRPAAANMLRSNMGLNRGERVLFLTDVPAPANWGIPFNQVEEIAERALMTRKIYEMMTAEFPDCPMDFLAFPATMQSGMEPPADVAAKLLEYDVAIIMTTFSLSHTNGREKATEKGVRIASMPGIEDKMFEPGGPMGADYNAVEKDSNDWVAKLDGADQVHITTPYGTDLRFSIKDRVVFADIGLYRKKGEWGNLPAGESAAPPVEGTAQGRLVVPAGWYPDLTENMTLVFEKGYVVSVEGGGAVGREFVETFHFDDDSFKHRRNCAELGIGTNPNAHRTDNVLEAEKIKGTVHIAVGDNIHMGGKTESDLHTDFILNQPTMVVDGKKLIG
jgi:aminopeptidase